MSNLNENINRIKGLMLISEDVSGNPITVSSDLFARKFRDKVNNILKELYQNTEFWLSGQQRGIQGRGGVVNIYTVHDLMKQKGLDDYEEDGGEWSILNYFDTNPMVRKTIVGLFERETGKIINNTTVMDEFLNWMSDNKDKLFKDGSVLSDLVSKNAQSLYNGEMNEKRAYGYLSNVLQNLPDWELQKRFLPGAQQDREGVDFVMKNKKTGSVAKFQVKPLASLKSENGKYVVKSYNISQLKNKPVNYFVFASKEKEDVYVFKNIKDKYVLLDSNTIVFEYPPVEF